MCTIVPKTPDISPEIETLSSSLANCSPLQNNLRSEEIIPLCSPSTGYHFIIEINRGKVSHGWGVVGVLYFTTCVLYDSHATTTKHAAATLTMAQQPHYDESFLVAFLANPCQLPCIR
jgi:hypothetical protein